MTTPAELIAEARSHLYGRTRTQRNRLQGAVLAGATSLVCEYDVSSITAGTMLGIDLELFYVVSTDTALKTVTVLPAQEGTAAAAHADDSTVWINPRWSDFHIFREMNNGLDYLTAEGGLYKITTLDITYNPAVYGYDLVGSSGLRPQILEIRYKVRNGTGDWPRIREFQVLRNMATTEFASGNALLLHESAYPGQPMRIRYKTGYTRLTALDNNVETVSGLHAEAHRILPLLAAWKLVARDETRRNNPDAQGESRRPEEVPPGAILRSAASLKAEADEAIQQEKMRLLRDYPTHL